MTTLKYWQDRQKEFRDEKVANTKRQIEVSRELQKVSGAYEATSGRDHKIGARQGILNREIDVLSGRMRFIELGLRECETMIRTCTPAETSKSRSRYPLADRNKWFEIRTPDGRVKRIKHVSFEACREELQPGYTLRGEVFGVIDENGDGGIAVPLDSISDLMRHLQAQSKLEPLGRGHK